MGRRVRPSRGNGGAEGPRPMSCIRGNRPGLSAWIEMIEGRKDERGGEAQPTVMCEQKRSPESSSRAP